MIRFSEALDVLLAPGAAALQAVLIVTLVGLVVARECVRLSRPAARLALAVRLLVGPVLVLLALRLLVILQ